jgi:alanine racemase
MQNTLSVVDLGALRHNALMIKKLLGGKAFYAVVKANAYGHGDIEVASEIESLVDGFCVSIMDEGVHLRVGGITKPILVFTPPLSVEDVKIADFYGLLVTVNSVKTAEMVGDIPCHVKINSGMNRYGCSLDELDSVLSVLYSRNIKGVYSHLFMAENVLESERQFAYFNKAQAIVKKFNSDAVAHLSASGGIIRGGKYLFDGVRCGIMLYGYAPSGFVFEGLKPVLKVYAQVAQITNPVGGGVGYCKAVRPYDRLITYRLGYADGFDRGVKLGESNLCMDAFVGRKLGEMVTLPFCAGKWVCIFDNADEYAKRCGTISYEVLCSVTRRSEMVFVR